MRWHKSEKLCGTNTLLYNLHLTGCWRWWVCDYFHIDLWRYGSIPKAAALRVGTLGSEIPRWVCFYLSGLNSCTNRQIRMKQETELRPQSGALLLLKPKGMLGGGGTQPLPPLSPPPVCRWGGCIKESFSGWKQTPAAAHTEIFVTNFRISCRKMEKLLALCLALSLTASGWKTTPKLHLFRSSVLLFSVPSQTRNKIEIEHQRNTNMLNNGN